MSSRAGPDGFSSARERFAVGSVARDTVTIVLSYVGLTLRCFIAGTFAVAVVSKARNRASASEFALAITTLAGIRQQVAVRAIAVMVVLAETGTVALLELPVPVGPGFALACVSLVAFTAVLLAAIRRGVRQPCRCFGRSASEPGPANVARNLALLRGALAASCQPLLTTPSVIRRPSCSTRPASRSGVRARGHEGDRGQQTAVAWQVDRQRGAALLRRAALNGLVVREQRPGPRVMGAGQGDRAPGRAGRPRAARRGGGGPAGPPPDRGDPRPSSQARDGGGPRGARPPSPPGAVGFPPAAAPGGPWAR